MLRNWTSNQVRHRQINRKLPNRRTNKMEKKSPQGEGRKRKKKLRDQRRFLGSIFTMPKRLSLWVDVVCAVRLIAGR